MFFYDNHKISFSSKSLNNYQNDSVGINIVVTDTLSKLIFQHFLIIKKDHTLN